MRERKHSLSLKYYLGEKISLCSSRTLQMQKLFPTDVLSTCTRKYLNGLPTNTGDVYFAFVAVGRFSVTVVILLKSVPFRLPRRVYCRGAPLLLL